jgi:hypothetical protein
MEPTTQWKFRWFWPWQDDREEAWLGNLSREGWHLSKFGFPRIYLFQKGDPKNFVYRLDYQTSRMKDREAYLQLFRDAGWEPVGKLAAWEYFRKETADGEAPEIFTDPESKIRKYRRILGTMTLLLIALILIGLSRVFSTEASDPGRDVLQLIIAAVIAVYGVIVVGLYRRIRQLRNNPRK